MDDIRDNSAIKALSANVIETQFDDFDKSTIDLAKNRIIDVVGCAIGGANAPGNVELVGLIKKWGGAKEATIWIHGGKSTA